MFFRTPPLADLKIGHYNGKSARPPLRFCFPTQYSAASFAPSLNYFAESTILFLTIALFAVYS
jgi:hypothetical protein